MSRPKFTSRCRTCCAPAALAIGAALLLPASVAITGTAHAQAQSQGGTLPPVVVEQKKQKPAKPPVHRHEHEQAPETAASPASPGSQPNSAASIGSTSLPASQIEQRSVSTSDTAALLADIPGVGVFTNGGASGLPAIYGFADDRLRIKVDGMDMIASCPNHMNPALSYIDPSQVKSVQVWTGVVPVSIGGDLLGGAIAVNSRDPLFASYGQGVVTQGSIGEVPSAAMAAVCAPISRRPPRPSISVRLTTVPTPNPAIIMRAATL